MIKEMNHHVYSLNEIKHQTRTKESFEEEVVIFSIFYFRSPKIRFQKILFSSVVFLLPRLHLKEDLEMKRLGKIKPSTMLLASFSALNNLKSVEFTS
jgi:hypothetical protein